MTASRNEIKVNIESYWAIFGVMCLFAVLLGFDQFGRLLVLSVWSAVVIALPAFSIIFLCARLGIVDPLKLGLAGLVGTSTFSYLNFWIWLINPTLGFIANSVFLAIFLLSALYLFRSANYGDLEKLRPWKLAGSAWLFYGLFIVTLGLAPFGLELPLENIAGRFTHPLPIDNQLPRLFALQISGGEVLTPMVGDWLSSDRPPLQTAFYLSSGAFPHFESDLFYFVHSSFLQCLWLPALWLMLKSINLSPLTSLLTLLVCAISGSALVHGVFTWPKLLPAAFILLLVAVFLSSRKETLDDSFLAVLIGAASALSMLAHGGSIFALLGLGVYTVFYRKIPSLKCVAVAVSTGLAILLTWSLYQHFFDPPGDRLLKWHLAGVIPIDERSFSATLIESYASLEFSEIVSNKLENVKSILGGYDVWPSLVAKAAIMDVSGDEAYALRLAQFFSVFAALGLFAVSPILLLLPSKRSHHEKTMSKMIFFIVASTLLAWVLLLFGPGFTIIHQGTLALILLAFAASVMACMSIHRFIGIFAALAHVALTFEVYVFHRPESGISELHYASLMTAALVCLLFALFSMRKLCYSFLRD